jgi:hypothetical protein
LHPLRTLYADKIYDKFAFVRELVNELGKTFFIVELTSHFHKQLENATSQSIRLLIFIQAVYVALL